MGYKRHEIAHHIGTSDDELKEFFRKDGRGMRQKYSRITDSQLKRKIKKIKKENKDIGNFVID